MQCPTFFTQGLYLHKLAIDIGQKGKAHGQIESVEHQRNESTWFDITMEN